MKGKYFFPPVHGGNLAAFAARYGKAEEEILDFSSNINPLGPPASVLRAYQEAAGDLARYPDPYARLLCEMVAGLFSLSSENVIAGNGSLALLDLAIRVLSPKRALIAEPCFTEYRRLLELGGAEVDSLLLRAEDGFRIPLGELLRRRNNLDLLLLGHPNNPTGTSLSPAEMKSLLKEAGRLGVFVILDEAFVDWSPEISGASEAGNHDHLLVIRSLTKFFALAGIRSGFALGPRPLIARMKELQGPWSCNRIAQKLSAAALRDADFAREVRRWFQTERAWCRGALEGLQALRVFPGLANFFLLRRSFLPWNVLSSPNGSVGDPRFPPKDGSAFLVAEKRAGMTTLSNDLEDFLGERGIYVRFLEDMRGLDGSYLRAAVRKREENERLVGALSEWMGEKQNNVSSPYKGVLSSPNGSVGDPRLKHSGMTTKSSAPMTELP